MSLVAALHIFGELLTEGSQHRDAALADDRYGATELCRGGRRFASDEARSKNDNPCTRGEFASQAHGVIKSANRVNAMSRLSRQIEPARTQSSCNDERAVLNRRTIGQGDGVRVEVTGNHGVAEYPFHVVENLGKRERDGGVVDILSEDLF
ncbi:unannotated protein [freshwater metagenome]|uniref:Unannotated protein n=1 Tax=freshwater metagenome TaxID=449393 RepID=A0A6J6DV85_9ZZZZ